jgi:hypothetical protein
VVVLEFSIHDLTALEVREAVNHGCTHFSFAFDYRLDEVHEVPFVGVVELDDHAHVDQIHHDLLFVLPQSLHHIELLLPALHIELLHLLSIELHASYFSLQSEKQFFEVSLNLGEGVVRLLFYLDEDVSSVAVSVDKVIFHQHLEKSGRAKSCDDFAQGVWLLLIVSHWVASDESFNQNRFHSRIFERQGKVDFRIILEHLVKFV